MKPLRIYVDTSVFGGCCDEEFAEDSRRLLKDARRGAVIIVLSDIVVRELQEAPVAVREVVTALPPAVIEPVQITKEVIDLRDAYLEAEIVARRWLDDAAHVAAATVVRADAIVSWNFSHIVRLDKMKAYNRVNFARGYGFLTIVTPREVMVDENAEDKCTI